MKVVFVGPSLSWAQAQALVPEARLRGPARQGDVFAALEEGATAIALIDGVFETSPSVWHHELVAASGAGVTVLGASSMGALRAAELPGYVVPVGEIAKRFVSGEWNDDAYVALLHGDESTGYKPLTVPWVNVWATAQAAVAAGVCTSARARELVKRAEDLFYQERTWGSLLDALRWAPKHASALEAFVRARAVDLKAEDARVCLRRLARLRTRRAAPAPVRLSSFVRRTRMSPLNAHSDADEEQGVRTLLLAEFARIGGVTASPARVAAWRSQLGVGAADVRERWAEALALEEMILSMPERFVSDGPTRGEGAALKAARLK